MTIPPYAIHECDYNAKEIVLLTEEIVRVTTERDSQYDDNVERIAAQGKAEFQATQLEAQVSRLKWILNFLRTGAASREVLQAEESYAQTHVTLQDLL